jgi:hypothetical protein
MMKMLFLTILALLGVTQSAAQAAKYDIAVGYQYADGFTSCQGQDDLILQTVTLPGVRSTSLGDGVAIGDVQWTAAVGDGALELNSGNVRRLRLRVLQALTDSKSAEKTIATQIMKQLSAAKDISCIKKDGVTVFLSKDKGTRNRDLEGVEAVEEETVEEATVEDTEGEQGQRLLHGCQYHRCDAACWCSHGTPYYCQFSC